MNCFDWLYQSLKKRQAQESDLPKVILKPHRYHVQINEAPDVAPPTEAAYTEQSAGEVLTHTSSTTAKSKALHPEDELIADVDGGFEYSYKKPEAVHLSLGKCKCTCSDPRKQGRPYRNELCRKPFNANLSSACRFSRTELRIVNSITYVVVAVVILT